MSQPPQYQPPRRTGTFSSQQQQQQQQHDELHMSSMAHHQGQQMSPRDYSTAAAPHIKLDQASPNLSSQMPSYQSSGAVPNVLQPGGMAARQPAVPSNAATHQHSEYQSHQSAAKPSSLSVSHPYSGPSPSAPYESSASASSYMPYTPATPGGASSSSQYMSPTEPKYTTSNSQRNVPNTPLGLADIRPRADSSLSDGLPGTPGFELQSVQPRTSNYMAPWALYALDWCKWAPHGNSAGKLAIGSYLEDGHNFVSASRPVPLACGLATAR